MIKHSQLVMHQCHFSSTGSRGLSLLAEPSGRLFLYVCGKLDCNIIFSGYIIENEK